ncbi:hypothetical protein POTOM_059250 [Populus tomentosa]|uniref:Uncharacterized protein n=1 Tax=Populus tomentosa TaxID=118781 RepID=A0A8X8C1E7_POPTO|nr:hypothetical protein POTOM_059250 [Populus tomentosa]
MSKQSPRIIQGLLKLHYNHVFTSKPSPLTTPSLASRISSTFTRPYSNASSNFTPLNSQIPCFTSKPTSSNLGLSQFLSCTKPNSSFSKNGSFFYGVRQFSFKGSSDLGKKVDGNFAKKLLEKPATAVTSAFSRYREALGLQIDAFLKRNSLFLFGAGGVIICALLWRIMFGIANTFVSLSEGMAKYGFLALSSAIVAFSFSLIAVENSDYKNHGLDLVHKVLYLVTRMRIGKK